MREGDRGITEGFKQEELDEALGVIASTPSIFAAAALDFNPFPYQMRMLDDPSPRIVVCAARRVGKSLVMAVRALWFAITHPRTSTLIVAATQRQSMLMFDKLSDFVSKKMFLRTSVVRQTRTLLTFTNGSRIVALPCGRYGRTLRGETADLVIIDEAAFVPEEVILEVMMPMLSTTNGTIILLSTPYDKAHFFYRAFNSQIFSKYRFVTSDNPLVRKEFLEEQLELLGERRFKQEYLAEFVDDESTFFPMDSLRKSVHTCEKEVGFCEFCSSNSGGKMIQGALYAGYDPGGMKDPAALVVVQKIDSNKNNSDETFKPPFRVVFSKSFHASKKGDTEVYIRSTVEIADIHKKSPFRSILVDSTGVGGPILSHCKELGLPAVGLNLHRKTEDDIFSNLKILIERKMIELPNDRELLFSLNCIEAERNRTGGYIFSHPSGTHDDLAFALALAVWSAGKGGTIIPDFRKPPPQT